MDVTDLNEGIYGFLYKQKIIIGDRVAGFLSRRFHDRIQYHKEKLSIRVCSNSELQRDNRL